jgi:hypothetical protein
VLLSYSPSRCDPALLWRLTVGKSRENLIETLVEAVRTELGGEGHQHQLVIGPRGSGKTHVLTLVADRLESDSELRQRTLPVPLAEEEVVGHPADLFVKILERLEGRLVDRDGLDGSKRALAECRDVLHRLRSEEDDDEALALAAGSLEEMAAILDRLLVPLVENLNNILYAAYARKQAARTHWALRKVLTESKSLMLLASTPSLFGDVVDEGAPFYGFFRTHVLGELSPTERIALIRRRIEVELRDGCTNDAIERRLRAFLANFDRRSASWQGLLGQTGGLPRFVHLLFDLLVETDVESVVGLLERFLDKLTPHFQPYLDPRNLPQAQLEILETLATADGPMLLSEVSAEIRGAIPGNVSNYLKRLRQAGLVRQLQGRSRTVRYDLTEPLFRVWRRFRVGRNERERIVTLAKLFQAVYEPIELQAERDDPGLPEETLRQRAVDRALAHSVQEEELADIRGYGIDDPEQELAEIRRHDEKANQRKKDLEEVDRALQQRRAYHTLASISDETFQRFVELVRWVDEDGVRTGLIRFCVLALADHDKLLEWLPRFEVELPAPRRELLRPIRLAAEILDGREDRGLSAETEEMRRAVSELLAKSEGANAAEVNPADLAGEMIQALLEQPTSNALDALWALRLDLEQEDPRNPKAMVTLAEAMAACGKNADDWVRQTVRHADPATEPVYALAYLLTRIENGPTLWRELKDVLFAKVTRERERSVATCLESFHDDGYIDWLIDRVNRTDDFLGAAARRALFVLCPGRPPDPVADELWESSFYLAPSWWLLPHLNADPRTAADLVAAKAATSEEPLGIAWSLPGLMVGRVAPETLDRFLDATAEIVSRELAEPTTENGSSLWKPCLPLSRVRSLPLIERFEARQGTELDHDLSRWLCLRGANNSWVHRPTEARAIRVLERIGGEGISRLANHYLRDGRTWPALLTAIELAVMRPDESTADLLFEVAMRETVESAEGNGYPIAQPAAVGALVTIGRLDLAFRGAMKWGLKLSRKVVALFAESHPTEEDLKPVIEAIETTDNPDPGAVFALGLAKRKEEVPRLHSILDAGHEDSELARACLFSLYLIGDDSPATVRAFIDNLGVPGNDYPSWLGLFKIHSPEALAALKDRLVDFTKDHVSSTAMLIAINLLMAPDPDIRREVAEYLWTELNNNLVLLYRVTEGEVDAFGELDRQDVRDWLRDLALEGHWMDFGAQLGAIRALAKWDRNSAFEAARQLATPDAHNRADAPALLLEIDSDRALLLLRDWVEKEEKAPVLASIGEDLHLAGHLPVLLEWLEDPSPRLREGACLAAEILPWTDDLARILRERLYDEVWSVRVAANQALDRIWHAREIERLVEEIITEDDSTRRWRLLDVALEGGHPGLSGPYSRQAWVALLFEHLPLAMRQRAVDRLEKRRKKVHQDLKKRMRSA